MGTRSSFLLALATSAIVFGSPVSLISRPAPAYLPAVGPTLIRFKAPEKISNIVDLQPLVMEDTPPEVQDNPTSQASVGSGTKADPEMFPFPRISLWGSIANLSELSRLPLQPEPDSPPDSPSRTLTADDLLVVTPQMLVDFFKPIPGNGTNAPGASVIVPVNFTPPAINATPSSQAIYRTP